MSRALSRNNDHYNVAKTDTLVSEYSTYEDFLNAQVNPLDIFYLEDEEVARDLVELGIKGVGEVVAREDFEAKKLAAEINKQGKRDQKQVLTSQGHNFENSPLLAALAEREEKNRNGMMTTIIFVRDKNKKDQEISGYIDYASRLETENFELYFSRKRKFLPKASDLSFYNWDTQVASMHDTSNYQVLAENVSGLIFKNKIDRKTINVDPKVLIPGDNTDRFDITDSNYSQIVIFDHITRRKI